MSFDLVPDPGVPCASGCVPRQDHVARQKRSAASLERMLDATDRLMTDHQSEAFTLLEVCRIGGVSVGSIYLRFPTKVDLIRAAMQRRLIVVEQEEAAMMAQLCRDSVDLAGFLSAFIESYSQVLQRHARILRLCMDRAEHDPVISAIGKAQAERAAQRVVQALLAYRDRFGGNRAEEKADTIYRAIYAVLCRQLGLGSAREDHQPQQWMVYKKDLALMALSFLSCAQ
ncbi:MULTISPECIES: TetR/AcrR family transcriptional regulator [unclassified Sphingomonas]|uniref:TetR/AcrR family transcriptional regulator n=1 Tax=Novosphingobium rhizosphaerae TaxID=1551649 RepID=UPI0015CE96EF